MKSHILLFCFLLCRVYVHLAQVVIPEKGEITFPQTYVGDTAWQSLKLFNPWPEELTLSLFVPNEKGDNLFLHEEIGGGYLMGIEAYDTVELSIPFIPVQNTASERTLHIRSTIPYGEVQIQLRGSGKFPNPYYDRTENLRGEELILALRQILTEGQETFSYNEGRNLIFMEVDNLKNYPGGPDSNALVCIYTHRKIGGFSDRREAQAMKFNTEHVWPQSLFDKKLPMKSDLHHIFPTDAEANNRRSNHPFGPIGEVRWERQGSRLGQNNYFLPRKESRGIIARAMFYVATRYENYGDFLKGQEESLREWHLDQLPDDRERLRNEKVFEVQGNRNPFVDYPQLAYRIPTFRWREDSTLSMNKKAAKAALPGLDMEPMWMIQPHEIKRLSETEFRTIFVFRKEFPSEVRIYDKNGQYLEGRKGKVRRVKTKNNKAQLLLFKIGDQWKAWKWKLD